MPSKILTSDNSQPSLVSSDPYVSLVDRVNVLSNMQVTGGTFKVSDGNAVLTIDKQAGGGGGIGGATTAILKLENGTLRLYNVVYTTAEDIA